MERLSKDLHLDCMDYNKMPLSETKLELLFNIISMMVDAHISKEYKLLPSKSEAKPSSHSSNNIIWQARVAGKMEWDEAMEYAKNLRDDGYCDWRLPTVKELVDLISYESYEPATNFPGFTTLRPGYLDGCYWTLYPCVASTYEAWWVNLNCGSVDSTFRTSRFNVRCVRTNI